jgi:hypothetical protein
MKNLKKYFLIGGLMLKNRIQRAPRVYFHVETLYYRFMDVFIKKISLFLLTLVACIILSMSSWLIDCKYLQRIFKLHRLKVKIFMSLKN